MDTLSIADLFWMGIVVAGSAAEVMNRVESRRSRRAAQTAGPGDLVHA